MHAYSFLSAFERLLERGRPAAALAEFLTRMEFVPARLPRFIKRGVAGKIVITAEFGHNAPNLGGTAKVAALIRA